MNEEIINNMRKQNENLCKYATMDWDAIRLDEVLSSNVLKQTAAQPQPNKEETKEVKPTEKVEKKPDKPPQNQPVEDEEFDYSDFEEK